MRGRDIHGEPLRLVLPREVWVDVHVPEGGGLGFEVFVRAMEVGFEVSSKDIGEVHMVANLVVQFAYVC
jgi:hypothetical protein